ncbi:PP2C family protein-serine/threonine phosphatase [Nocardia sp. 004]|uniref:PP2C family protein-serine/threonine phosphatase n=1 Tax=Nocardia sp. 004 TaxID=3385978 RepID=UPI0039A00EDB
MTNRPPFTVPIAANAHAEHIGSRDTQQDAAYFSTRIATYGAYLVAAIADGVGSATGSEYIARAAVEAVCALGAAADYGDYPAELLPLAAAVLPLHVRTAETAAAVAFSGFADGPGYGYRPDATIAVATIDDDAAIQVGWLGDCRVWVELANGRLLRLTDDHNMAKFGRPNVVTRTLGEPGEEGPARAQWHHNGDPELRPVRVLLTTDGVHGPLSERAIRCALTNAPNAQRAALWLTKWAVRADGPRADNASALLFEIAPAEPDPADGAGDAEELAPF